jgi:hypothetical protein
MQVFYICLVYFFLFVTYFVWRKILEQRKKNNVINFSSYYNKRRNKLRGNTKKNGEIIYLMPPSAKK